MNRQTKRLLAKQEKAAERERARAAALGGGRGGGSAGRGGSGGRGGGSTGGWGGPSAAGGSGSSTERVGRIARMRRFIREVRQELKKVAWPTRGEVVTYTVVVLVSVTFVALMVFGLDYLFGEGALALYSTN